LAFASVAFAQDECRITTKYVWQDDIPPQPVHQVEFVFSGVDNELVVLTVDERPVFEARLTTENWTNEFSGEFGCLMSGRYWVNVKIGEAEGNLWFDVSQETTIYLSKRRGVMSFNIWGPDAPGLD